METDMIEIVAKKLYWHCDESPPSNSRRNILIFNIDARLRYDGYFSDFGPYNLANIVLFCRSLRKFSKNPKNLNSNIVYYTINTNP